MAQVPYNPVPDVTPDAAPTRPQRVHVTDDMFGANVGTALSSVGAELERGGDRLFADAIRFRQMDIENEVNEGATTYLEKSGDLSNKFHLMEGQDPQKNYETHVQALESLRQGIRDGLSSDYARKMFDRETMRRMGYDIVNAGGYAATQARAANKQQRQANVDATIDSMVRDPLNEGAIDDGLRKIAQFAGQDSIESGDRKAVMTAKTEVAIGRAVDAVAKSIAKTDPDRAIAFLKKFEGYTHTAQFQSTMDAVEERGIKVRADLEATRIATPVDAILDRAQSVTKDQESGGNYGNVTTTKDKNGNPQSALGAYGIMDRNLPEWSRQVLGREVTKEEFLKSPEIQDQIYRAKMGEYIRRYGVEGAGRAWFGGEGAVNNPAADNKTDAFGTKVLDYGKVFASKIGLVSQGRDLGERGIQQMMQDAETSANLYYPNDPERRQQYLNTLEKSILARTSVQNRERAERTTALGNALQNTLNKQMPNGRGPTSFMEAGQLDPSFADNFEELNKLDPRTNDKIQQAFIKNGKADVPWTPQREQNYTRFVGMSDEDFAQQDFNKEFNEGNLTLSHSNKLAERQAMMKKKAFESLHADAVIRQFGATLNDAHIYPSRSESGPNKRFETFRGAVIRNLEDYVQEHNAPMPQKEQEEMVKRLLKDTVTGKYFGVFNSYTPSFEVEARPDVTISSQAEYDKLDPGQHYIWNGQKYKKKGGDQ